MWIPHLLHHRIHPRQLVPRIHCADLRPPLMDPLPFPEGIPPSPVVINATETSPRSPQPIDHSLIGLIPEFSGDETGPSALTFEKAVLQAQRLAQWSDEYARGIVDLKMRGPAQLFIIHDPVFAATTNLKEALKLLKKRFEPQQVAGTNLQRLIAVYQKGHETVQAYGSRVRHLVAQATPIPQGAEVPTLEIVTMVESIGKHFFLMGLLPHLKDKVLSASPKTLAEAIDKAVLEELNAAHFRLSRSGTPEDLANRFMALEVRSRDLRRFPSRSPERPRGILRSRSGRRDDGRRAPRNSPSTSPRPSGMRNNRESRPRERVRNTACFGCGEEGHFRSECPRQESRRSDSPRPRWNAQRGPVRFQSPRNTRRSGNGPART